MSHDLPPQLEAAILDGIRKTDAAAPARDNATEGGDLPRPPTAESALRRCARPQNADYCRLLFIDMNGDGIDDLLLLLEPQTRQLYLSRKDGWALAPGKILEAYDFDGRSNAPPHLLNTYPAVRQGDQVYIFTPTDVRATAPALAPPGQAAHP